MNLLEALEHDLELEEELREAGITGDAFDDTMEAEGVFNDKLERCIAVINKRLSHITAKKNEIDRMKKGLESDERNVENLKKWVTYVLQRRNIKKAITPLYTVSLRQSQSVEITGELDNKYMRTVTKTEPDKTLIKEALKAGEEVSGARLVTKDNLNFK